MLSLEINQTPAGLEAVPDTSGIEATPAGLEAVPDTSGIEATPAERYEKSTPQTMPGPEKEVDYTADREVTSQNDGSSNLNGLFAISPLRKGKKYWFLTAAVALIVIVVIAIAVPLGMRKRKPLTSYVRKL
ncbi:hypothetical protein OEA41_009567 [Lepraria neglecta]|uniref:Uncharacterized protein n=1 Tax=Lepraria neglecta TaxID=209136 RepID=A0AAD9Z3C4_9LECA|nr:hypothetical protein OEA41_009567 [Lepraria neglecta]